MRASFIFTALAGLAVVSADACPAPGMTNAAGDKGCDPAQKYPGQACALVGGCYVIRGLGLATSTTSTPPATASCPPAGSTNAAGDYGCNPAHQYPDKACALVGGCYVLRGLGYSASRTSSAPPVTTSCPPAGKTNAAGDYGCNPAHHYPNKACALIGGCYVLRGLGYSNNSTVTSVPPTMPPKPCPTCPPATGTGMPSPVITGGASRLLTSGFAAAVLGALFCYFSL